MFCIYTLYSIAFNEYRVFFIPTVFPFSSEFPMSILTEKIESVYYQPDQLPHIVVDGNQCTHCKDHPCLGFCPAECFSKSTGNQIDYSFLACLECGTCLLLCNKEAVKWDYPRGGYGVKYRF